MSEQLLNGMVALLPKLRAYAILLTRVTAEGDDLVQETLLRAWRYRDGFVEGSNLKAWLFKILRNEFLTRARASRFEIEDIDGKYAAQLVSNPDQEIQVRYRELLGGIGLLSNDAREALLLTLGAGFTYEEAARLCGCRVGTMKSRVNRARAFLMDHVEGHEAPGFEREPMVRRSVAAVT